MTFLLDSSVVSSRRLNALVPAAVLGGHSLLVPALIYAELMFQYCRNPDPRFTPQNLDSLLEQYEPVVSVQALTKGEAGILARSLGARFPSEAEYVREKRNAYQRCFGEHPKAPPDSQKCGAPLDTFVVGLASPVRPVITEDGGPEWRGWPNGTVIRFSDAVARLGVA